MLSTENPPSPDPSCSCSSRLIKTSGDSNLKDNKSLQLKVDLSESGFDDRSIKLLSNFTIRDYVFRTRDKDIKTHWPFSPKKLQLCLKHGLKDVLPPFETLECVRINSIPADITLEDSNINPDLKITCLSNNLLSVSPSNVRRKLASDLGNIKPIRSQEDKEYRSTTTSQSCSDISSVRIIKIPPEPETQDSPELTIPASNKVVSSTQNKRCGLLMKLSNLAVPQSTKDAMKTPVVADTTSSKICPVCKTFSSSSNTTLNAHIDQCLSGGPTSNGMENSKVIKHRIKPRKTRLMVDIYATALHCTLEDLDRRNGTNWASNSGQAHCSEANSSVRANNDDEKNDPFSSMKFADKNVEGPVYVDSTGTKLRILSKFGDLPRNNNAVDDCSTMKHVKGDKGTRFLSSRKKYLIQNLKLLKSSSHAEIPDDHCHKTTHGVQKNVFSKKGCRKLVPKQHIEPCHRVKSNDFGVVKQWVGSKRTILKKKKKDNLERESRCMSKTMKNLRVKSGPSQVRDMFGKGTIGPRSPLSAESRKRKKNLSFHSHNKRIERPCLRMRKEINDDSKRSDHLMHSTLKDLDEDNSSALECVKDLRNDTEAHTSSSGDKDVITNVSSGLKADVAFTRSRMSKHQTFSPGTKDFGPQKNTSSDHKILLRGKKFSSCQNNLSSGKHLSAADSNKTIGTKCLGLRKRKLCYVSDSDDEAIMFRPEGGRQYDPVETSTENAYQGEQLSNKSSGNKFTNLKAQKKIWGLVNSGKGGDLTSPGLIKPLRCNSHYNARNADFRVDDNVTAGTSNASYEVKEVQSCEELAREPICQVVEAGAITVFDDSLDAALPEIPPPSYTECVLQHYGKAGDEVTEARLLLNGDKEIIPMDNDHDLVITNSNALVETDADEGHGNYYADIDPIPIPGPPGSFLPSPRHMGSDELEGISSLTTCRLPSSEDEQEVVGMDSSGSPVSATSIVSNSIADGSNSASVMDRSMQLPRVRDEARCDAREVKTGLTVDAGAEREDEFDRTRTIITCPHSFSNSQPCRCSVKDGCFQTGSLGCRESQLLKRRNMNSLPLFPVQNQMDGDTNNEVVNSKLRSGVICVEELVSEHEQIGKGSSIAHDKGCVSHSSYESPSPSTPNPILRLMGKNLMVVNKEENPSTQTRPISAIANERTVLQCFNDDVSKTNIHIQRASFNNISGQGPSMLSNAQSFKSSRYIEYGSSDGFRTPAAFMNSVIFPRQSFNGNCASSFEGQEYSVGFNPNPDQHTSSIEVNMSKIYESEKVQTRVRARLKEVIVIDDSTEHDAMNLSHVKPAHHVGGFLAPSSSASRHDARNVNTFYICQTQNHPTYTGTQLGLNTQAEVPYSSRMHENIEKWNLTPQSARVLCPNLFPASSRLSGHLLSSSSVGFSASFPLHKNFS